MHIRSEDYQPPNLLPEESDAGVMPMVPTKRINSANPWKRRAFKSQTLTKSSTSALKDEEVKVTRVPFHMEVIKPHPPKMKPGSQEFLSRTLNPNKLRKVKSSRRRSRARIYDDVLNSSLKRSPLKPVAIEDKYSWLKRFSLAAKR
mmetsp:Transcript_7733/g.14666  ORF Transcript_7733/g.14666 Transcript_7733/m.14666 type:complete len:146 (-) Transcript_7733:632-1069(-)